MKETYISTIEPKGRCVIAERMFHYGECIMCNYVITTPIKHEGFSDWIMEWNDYENAIALGHINLLNHSDDPNCMIRNDYEFMHKSLYALRDIKEGEELTVKYKCKLWFKPVE